MRKKIARVVGGYRCAENVIIHRGRLLSDEAFVRRSVRERTRARTNGR